MGSEMCIRDRYQVETHEIVLKSKLKIRRSCGNRKEIYELFE